MSTHGKFVWHDLMTTDLAKAKPFYEGLFGWTVKAEPMGDMPYNLILLGGKDIGGMMQLDPAHGAPSHWFGYVTVEKVEAAVERATAKGGKQLMAPMAVPEVGRFALASDPQGGVFAPFEYTRDLGKPEAKPAPGSFCWDELMAPDTEKAKAFYTHVFGWTTEAMDMGPAGTYTLWKRGTESAGGMMKWTHGPSAFWMPYIAVASADATAERAVKLGGKVGSPPADIPNVGRFAVLVDPTGGHFGVLQG